MVTGTEEKRDRYSELPKSAAYEKTHTQHLTISPTYSLSPLMSVMGFYSLLHQPLLDQVVKERL